MVWNALPEEKRDDATVERCRDKILADYGKNYLVKTTMYPGIADLLDALTARHIRLCVLSNKPDVVTKKIIAELFAPWKFDCALGAGVSVPEDWHPSFAGEPGFSGKTFASGESASGPASGGGSALSASAKVSLAKSLASSEKPADGFRFLAMKPEPEAVFYICEQLGMKPAEVVYIGDSDVDMQTAANAGMRSIGVSWGFRGRQELADGEKEYQDGEQEYADGLAEVQENESLLADGEQQLEDGRKQLADAQAEYDAGVAQLSDAEQQLADGHAYGQILRSKGMLKAADGEGWYYFDLVPGEYEIRQGEPDYTGKVCVIGSELAEDRLAEAFLG